MPAPDLEERFIQPKNWQTGEFNSLGKRVHYGFALPQDREPHGIVLCLPGLSEFTEKYYEVARECLSHNLAFYVIDWPGQGRSERYLSNPQKRHGKDFTIDVERVEDFVSQIIKPEKPLAVLGHSMGANIGLRVLSQSPDLFKCAAFSAPMCGILSVNKIPFGSQILSVLNRFFHESYVSGGGDWHASMRDEGKTVFSHDPARNALHGAWVAADPALAVGSPTFGWLYYAHQSCQKLIGKHTLGTIKTPCIIATGSKETIVDNRDTCTLVSKLDNAELLELEGAAHEILMEVDELRGQFMEQFFTLIDAHFTS